MKSFAKSPLVPAPERPSIALGDSLDWNYDGTDIPVVGARDITLAEIVNPRFIVRGEEEPEAVLLSLTEIEADPRLLWVVEEGKRLNGGEEPEYKVAFSKWQEHAGEPVGAWIPEWDGSGVDRSLALGERQYRFAKQALDDAGVLRQYLVVLAARLGRSRRVVGETLGLSAARVQQLSEAPPSDLLAEVDDFIAAATQIAILLGSGTCPSQELPRPHDLGADELDELIVSMISAGLAEEVADGLKLTDDGLFLLNPKDKSPKPAKGDPDRKGAGLETR